jgi:hypothetical protein
MSETRKIAAILVSDVVGYSRLAGADEDRILWLANRGRKEWGQNGNTDPGDGSAHPGRKWSSWPTKAATTCCTARI